MRAVLLFAARATAAPADGGRGAVLPVRVARAGGGGGCRGAGTRAQDRRVEEMGVRYGLGLGEGTDRVRVGVDAEGLVCEDR